jgi:hypothetical protein
LVKACWALYFDKASILTKLCAPTKSIEAVKIVKSIARQLEVWNTVEDAIPWEEKGI